MFKKRFVILCNKKGVPPTVACQAIGLSNATFSKWDDNSVPRRATLQKFADYFGVSVDYLLGNEDEKKPTDDGELSDVESALLELFRTLPEESQRMYLEVLRATLKKQ